MDTKLVLTIIGSVLSLIGVIFIAIPKVVNEKTMSNLPSEAVGISALFRAANGGLGLALGLVAIYCRNLPIARICKNCHSITRYRLYFC